LQTALPAWAATRLEAWGASGIHPASLRNSLPAGFLNYLAEIIWQGLSGRDYLVQAGLNAIFGFAASALPNV